MRLGHFSDPPRIGVDASAARAIKSLPDLPESCRPEADRREPVTQAATRVRLPLSPTMRLG